MTTKKTPAVAPAEATETPASVTGALSVLEASLASFQKDHRDLIEKAKAEAKKAGEEFAKRPHPDELAAANSRAEGLELELSTANLQLKEIAKEMGTAAEEVRTARGTADRLRGELSEAQETISALREAARADAELINTMRSRTEAIAAQFEAARNVLALPDLDLPAPSAEAAREPEAALEPAAGPAAPEPDAVPVVPAADMFGLDEVAVPVIEATTDQPEPEPLFPEPATDAKDDEGPFGAVPSFGTFRPVVDLPDADFDAPAPAKQVDPDFEDVAAGELELPDLTGPSEEPAAEVSLPDLDEPAAEAPGAPDTMVLPGLDGPADAEAAGVTGLELPDAETDKPFDPFGLLTLPDLEAEQGAEAKEPAFAGQTAS
jgi:hypothetical protein